MYSSQHVARPSQLRHRFRRPGFSVTGFSFAASCLAIELLAIIAISVGAGIGYHSWAYGVVGQVSNYIAVGILAALAYCAAVIIRDNISLESLADVKRRLASTLANWTYAFVVLVLVAFLTKTTATYSRGALLLFYFAGLGALLVLQTVFVRAVAAALASRRVVPRRVMLVGSAEELNGICDDKLEDWRGVRIVHRLQLPAPGDGPEALGAVLQRYSGKLRRLRLDDVIIVAPLSDPERIDHCVEAFSMLPVSIHLGAGRMLDRFASLKLRRVGAISALSLTGPPMAPLSATIKRASDIAMSLGGLICLSPLFAVVALLIKLDSPGPVFFKQRRLGFNQRQFRIIKFRTMTCQEDGDVVVQARQNDVRITRVGRWLRKFNIDELPQLINVFKADMSIVGPRPHALAHDREFEKRVLRYPRRLNVRPGITGWAQVNGFRGETDTDEKLAGRLEHDLYYIDNWSFGFDLYIMLLTFVSPKAFMNAL